MIVTEENGTVFVRVRKAEPIRNDVPVPDLRIVAVQHTVSDQDTEAEHLHQGLLATLPGGTYDRLFALMATHKASELTVAHRRLDGFVAEFTVTEPA